MIISRNTFVTGRPSTGDQHFVNHFTEEPQFNEVQRDWGNSFVILKPRFNEFLGKQAKCSLYRGTVNCEFPTPSISGCEQFL